MAQQIIGIRVEYAVLKLPCGSENLGQFCVDDPDDCCDEDHNPCQCCPDGTEVDPLPGSAQGPLGTSCSDCTITLNVPKIAAQTWSGSFSSSCGDVDNPAKLYVTVFCDTDGWHAAGAYTLAGTTEQHPFQVDLLCALDGSGSITGLSGSFPVPECSGNVALSFGPPCLTDHPTCPCCVPSSGASSTIFASVVGPIGPNCTPCSLGVNLTWDGLGWGGGGQTGCGQGGGTYSKIDFAVWCDAQGWHANGSLVPFGGNSTPFHLDLVCENNTLHGSIRVAGCGDALLTIVAAYPCVGSGGGPCAPSPVTLPATLHFTMIDVPPCGACSFDLVQAQLSGDIIWAKTGALCGSAFGGVSFGCTPASNYVYALTLGLMTPTGCLPIGQSVFLPVAGSDSPFWREYLIPECFLCGTGATQTLRRVRVAA